MKTIKTLLLMVALTASSVLAASTNVDDTRTESVTITEEIGKLLQNPSFLVDKDIVASVTLTINKNNEIVVLSVDTDESYLVSFIKNRLNYNELPKALKTNTKTFVVPVRIVSED